MTDDAAVNESRLREFMLLFSRQSPHPVHAPDRSCVYRERWLWHVVQCDQARADERRTSSTVDGTGATDPKRRKVDPASSSPAGTGRAPAPEWVREIVGSTAQSASKYLESLVASRHADGRGAVPAMGGADVGAWFVNEHLRAENDRLRAELRDKAEAESWARRVECLEQEAKRLEGLRASLVGDILGAKTSIGVTKQAFVDVAKAELRAEIDKEEARRMAMVDRYVEERLEFARQEHVARARVLVRYMDALERTERQTEERLHEYLEGELRRWADALCVSVFKS